MDALERWISQVSEGRSLRQVALDAGIPVATLSRQVRDGAVHADNVVRIARHYGRSPLAGLVALGLLAEHEVVVGDIENALQEVSDDVLVGEVLRRIQEGGPSAKVYDLPVPPVDDDDDEVEHLRTLNPAAFDADGEDLDAEVEAQQQEP